MPIHEHFESNPPKFRARITIARCGLIFSTLVLHVMTLRRDRALPLRGPGFFNTLLARTPAFAQLASRMFVRPAIRSRHLHSVNTAIGHHLLTVQPDLFIFCIAEPRLHRRTATHRHRPGLHAPWQLVTHEVNHIARFDVARGPGPNSVNPHMTATHSPGSKGPRLVKTGKPEPFVYA